MEEEKKSDEMGIGQEVEEKTESSDSEEQCVQMFMKELEDTSAASSRISVPTDKRASKSLQIDSDVCIKMEQESDKKETKNAFQINQKLKKEKKDYDSSHARSPQFLPIDSSHVSRMETTSKKEPSGDTESGILRHNKRKRKEELDSEKKESSSKSQSKKKKVNMELAQLLKFERATVEPGNDPNKIQLNVFDYNTINSDNYGRAQNGRAKREIKQTIRYDTTNRTYAQERKMQELARKTGSGFLCPKCSEHLSFDLKQCYNCGLKCSYAAGIGVVICKDRAENSQTKTTEGAPTWINHAQIDNIQNETSGSIRKSVKSKSKKSEDAEPVIVKVKIDLSAMGIKLKCNAPNENKLPSAGHLSGSNNHNADAVECEACLQLFPKTYINGHRKKLHKLSPYEFGCPYCPPSRIFKSKESRLKHIHMYHPGKPEKISDDDKARTKCFLYNCPICKEPFIYVDLQKHLIQEHNTDIDSQLERLTCSCPFCLSQKRPKRRSFPSLQSLKGHISTNHQFCVLIGKQINIGSNSSQNRTIQKVEKSKVAPLKETKVYEEVYQAADPKDDIEEMNWNELSFTKLKELLPMDRSISRSSDHEAMMKKIDSKLHRLQHLQTLKVKRGNIATSGERNFIEEQRLYSRGLRERTGKAEREKLEKLEYREKWEELNRKLLYQNRSKKKSKAELEYDELLNRPIKFMAGTRTRLDQRKECSLGENCDLCSGIFAHCIVTEEEIEKAGGNILNAFPLDSSKKEHIKNPSFRKIKNEKDIPDDQELPGGTSSKLSGSDERDIEDFRNLNTLKNCVQFVRSYNSGLLQSRKGVS